MFLHAADDFLVLVKSPTPKDFRETGQFRHRNVGMVSASGAAISRFGTHHRVQRPDDFAVAIAAVGETSTTQCGGNDLLHIFARALNAVSASDAFDENVKIDRSLDLYHV